MSLKIRPATTEDLEELSKVLRRAFEEDPFLRWILPQDKHWAKYSEPMWRMTLRSELAHETVLTNEGLHGVAVWRSADLGPATIWELLKTAFPMVFYLGLRSPLIFHGLQKLFGLHPKEPHWYLTVIGTDPAHQGQGIGTALIEPILERCRKENVSAYLEASRPENVPYYKRLGFEVVGEVQLPRGPTVWPMLFPKV